MDTTFNVLVIVLSCLLGIFLILSIAVIAGVLKLVSMLKRIVARAEQVVESAEAAADIFKRSAGPLGAMRTLTNIVEMVIKHNKRKD